MTSQGRMAGEGGLTLSPGVHRYSLMERVVYGRPVEEVLAQELERTGRRRVFLVSNRSLSNSTLLAGVAAALGPLCVGRYVRVRAHTPRECVVEGASAARQAGADLLLAVGGGSVIDATKAMLLCLRHGYTDPGQLDPRSCCVNPDQTFFAADAVRWVRLIAVPTTLSGAEFASSAGVTDAQRGLKQAFNHPMLMPQVVILDPRMTLETPMPLLLATGMKAVDHAVERIISVNANDYSDAVSALALRLLSAGLPGVRDRRDDLQSRLKLQYGFFMSMAGAAAGVSVGVSHAIGHVLGAHSHVAHGETSCVLLPAVMRWSQKETGERQRLVCQALGSAGAEAATALDELIGKLGLPRRLREVGVKREDFAAIAEKTMAERLLANSRRRVAGPEDIKAILESAW